jgi:hypothetical protein
LINLRKLNNAVQCDAERLFVLRVAKNFVSLAA